MSRDWKKDHQRMNAERKKDEIPRLGTRALLSLEVKEMRRNQKG